MRHTKFVRKIPETINDCQTNEILTEIKNDLKTNIVENESDSSDADSTKAQQISFMNNNKNVLLTSQEMNDVVSTKPLPVSTSIPLINLDSKKSLTISTTSVPASVLSSTPLFVVPSTSISTLPLISDSFIKSSIPVSTVQSTLFPSLFPPPPPLISNINVNLQPPLIPHSMIKKTILPIPVPIPPPVPVNFKIKNK